MHAKQFNGKLLMYEVRHTLGNPFMIFFGLIFPLFLLASLKDSIFAQAPQEIHDYIAISLFTGFSMMIPLSLALVGYGATYSQDVEKDIVLRFQLFGFSEKTTMIAKALAQLIVLTFAIIIYVIIAANILPLKAPTLTAGIVHISSIYLIAILLFALSHSVATISRKYGPTFFVTMGTYFLMMMLSGMMGPRPQDLPEGLQPISKLMPTRYFMEDFYDFWLGNDYDFMPMLKAFGFFGLIALIMLSIAAYKNKRK